MNMTRKFTVLIEKDEDGVLVAMVPDLQGCHTQAKTMPLLLSRIKEAIELCLEVKKSKHESFKQSEFVGIQQVELAV
jgi:predicted RNase H-like HicB family nuclease